MKQALKVPALALAGVLVAVALLGSQALPRRPGPALTDAALFDDSILHRIELQVSERDWATLRENFMQNTYYPATFIWRGETARNVGIRSRGTGTRSGTKPHLLVDFDRYVSGQRFLGLGALVLDNNLQDQSAMKEALTMAVHNRLGIAAPREASAVLYINGTFLGVYTMVERVDEFAISRMFDPKPAEPELVFPGRPPARSGANSGTRAPAPPAGRAVPATPLPAPQVEPLPTGYLFDYEWVDHFYWTYPGPDLDFYAERFEADTREDEPLETVYRPVERMFHEINEAPDDRFVERAGAWLDLRQFVRVAAIQAYMAEWDGLLGAFGMNNFYLYRPAAGPPHVIIPWDEDNTFFAVDYPVDSGINDGVVMRRAMMVPELRALFFETLEEVAALTEARGNDGLGWLEREVLRRTSMLRTPMAEDRVKPHTQEEFESVAASNLDFARRRAGIVRAQVREMER